MKIIAFCFNTASSLFWKQGYNRNTANTLQRPLCKVDFNLVKGINYSINEDTIQHAIHGNADANSCMNTDNCTTYKDSDTNLPYSSLVTLYILRKVNKQGLEKRRNINYIVCNENVLRGEDQTL